MFGAFRARARPSWFGIHLGFHQQIYTQALYVTIFPRGVTKKMQYRATRVALLWPVRIPERGSCPPPLPGPLLQLEAFWGLRVARSSCLPPAWGVGGVHSLGIPTLTQLQVCLSQFQLPLLFPQDEWGQQVHCSAVHCSRGPCPVIL